jgi:hypothetical protein
MSYFHVLNQWTARKLALVSYPLSSRWTDYLIILFITLPHLPSHFIIDNSTGWESQSHLTLALNLCFSFWILPRRPLPTSVLYRYEQQRTTSRNQNKKIHKPCNCFGSCFLRAAQCIQYIRSILIWIFACFDIPGEMFQLIMYRQSSLHPKYFSKSAEAESKEKHGVRNPVP